MKLYSAPNIYAPLPFRFWRHVGLNESGCLVWCGRHLERGYGRFTIGYARAQAHVWAYRNIVGPIPEGMVLDHLCRNRACVNPFHLEPVSLGENVLRGETRAANNKAKTHCPRGHLYAGQNLYVKPRGHGRTSRVCIICRTETKRRCRAAKVR